MLLFQMIVLQIVAFGVVIYFLKKIFYGDTQGAINRLEQAHQELLAKQKDLTQKIEAAEKEYGEKKEEAAQVIKKMTAQAMEEARGKEDELLKKARAQAEDIVVKAQASSEKHYREIEKQVYLKMLDLTADLLVSSFSEKTVEALHAHLIKEFLERGKEFDLAGVGSHITKMIIKTPLPLGKEVHTKIQSLVASKLNRNLELEEVVEKSVVAGFAIQFGTLVLDGTLANYVKQAAERKKIELQRKE